MKRRCATCNGQISRRKALESRDRKTHRLPHSPPQPMHNNRLNPTCAIALQRYRSRGKLSRLTTLDEVTSDGRHSFPDLNSKRQTKKKGKKKKKLNNRWRKGLSIWHRILGTVGIVRLTSTHASTRRALCTQRILGSCWNVPSKPLPSALVIEIPPVFLSAGS